MTQNKRRQGGWHQIVQKETRRVICIYNVKGFTGDKREETRRKKCKNHGKMSRDRIRGSDTNDRSCQESANSWTPCIMTETFGFWRSQGKEFKKVTRVNKASRATPHRQDAHLASKIATARCYTGVLWERPGGLCVPILQYLQSLLKKHSIQVVSLITYFFLDHQL